MNISEEMVKEIIVEFLKQMQAQAKEAPASLAAEHSKYGIEPYDKDWGTGSSGLQGESASPFKRIRDWRKQYLSTPLTLTTERAVLWTEAMNNSTGKPMNVRNAEAFAHVLRNVPIHIGKYELIVGNMAAPPRGAPVFPEFSYDWFIEEFDSAPFNKRASDRFEYTKETEETLKSLHSYWKDNTVHDVAKRLMSEEELKGTGSYGKGIYLLGNYFYGGIGHCQPYYEKLLNLGWGLVKKQIEKKLAEIDRTTPEGIEKSQFYHAELICVDAVMEFTERYAKLARKMAQGEENKQRKQELIQMAENCEWLAAGNKPRTFWEALQFMWIMNTVVCIEGNGHSIAYGRFDQYMYPFYKKDMAEGKVTKEFIQELIECLWLKAAELTKIRDGGSTKAFSGVELGGMSLTLGGLKPDGTDGTNEVSYMGVDAMAHTRITSPWLTTRHHANEPIEWWIKTVHCAKIGFGMPSFFNDEGIIPAMVNRGRSIEDARDYTALGCVEPDSSGREYGWHDAAFYNLNKVFELAINDGRCITCSSNCGHYSKCAGAGKVLGLRTGSLATFKSFEEVKEAFDKQNKYWVDRLVTSLNCIDFAHQMMKPLPYLSLLIDDCLEKGIDVTAGGAKYNFIGPQGLGVANVADGMSAIKKLVFDDKFVSGEEFLKALRSNWDGYEALHALVNSSRVPHFGNDDDEVDEMGRFVALSYSRHLQNRPTAHGGIFQPGLYPVSANVPHGAMQGASPDGRKAGEAVADGVSPVHTSRGSHDVSGPTAVAKSVSKLDHIIASNGTLLNMKFTPSTLVGNVGDENFIDMMKVYFQRKAFHNQINVVGRETLEAAQREPDKYRGLIVRVAGYSAYFTELDVSLQKDLIERTELAF